MPANEAAAPPARLRLPAAERKAEIVAAALKISGDIGPDSLTTEMIATEIGLTQPALFRHFPKKEMIWTAVAEKLTADMTAARAEAATGSPAPDARVKAIIAAQARMISSTPGLAAILFSRELHVRNAELRAGMAKNQKAVHEELEAAFAQGIESGAFRASLNASDAAFLVIAVLQGLALRWSLSGKKLDLPGETRRLADLLLRGLT